jgi:hypothetical protein
MTAFGSMQSDLQSGEFARRLEQVAQHCRRNESQATLTDGWVGEIRKMDTNLEKVSGQLGDDR